MVYRPLEVMRAELELVGFWKRVLRMETESVSTQPEVLKTLSKPAHRRQAAVSTKPEVFQIEQEIWRFK